MSDDVDQVVVRLKATSRRAAGPAARAATTAMARAYQRGVVATELSRYSHTRGTRTPSPPGEPPARVSGALARSIKTSPAKETEPGHWSSSVGPRVVYGRIQELGGQSGRGRRTTTPPRPYLRPAVDRMRGDGTLHRVAVEAFGQALK
jgi:phage gpG-like protein